MITTDKEFEDKLAQLARLYRAQRELWSQTDASDEDALAKFVAGGAKILELLTEVLGSIEDYTGTAELRIIWDRLKAIRLEREQPTEKA